MEKNPLGCVFYAGRVTLWAYDEFESWRPAALRLLGMATQTLNTQSTCHAPPPPPPPPRPARPAATTTTSSGILELAVCALRRRPGRCHKQSTAQHHLLQPRLQVAQYSRNARVNRMMIESKFPEASHVSHRARLTIALPHFPSASTPYSIARRKRHSPAPSACNAHVAAAPPLAGASDEMLPSPQAPICTPNPCSPADTCRWRLAATRKHAHASQPPAALQGGLRQCRKPSR